MWVEYKIKQTSITLNEWKFYIKHNTLPNTYTSINLLIQKIVSFSFTTTPIYWDYETVEGQLYWTTWSRSHSQELNQTATDGTEFSQIFTVHSLYTLAWGVPDMDGDIILLITYVATCLRVWNCKQVYSEV